MQENLEQKNIEQEPRQLFLRALSELTRNRLMLTQDGFPTLLGDLESLCGRYKERNTIEAETISALVQTFRASSIRWSLEERLEKFKELMQDIQHNFIEGKD